MNFGKSIEGQFKEIEVEKDAKKVIEAKEETLTKNKFGEKYKAKRKKANIVSKNNRRENRRK